MQRDNLLIFDTTLRDGEQSPGVTLSLHDKLEIAKKLYAIGVDVCEAGFPIASKGDFLSVQAIARHFSPKNLSTTRPPMTIAALARATKVDIQKAYDAVHEASSFRCHTFLATSDLHLEYKLKISREKCIETAVDAVKFAKQIGFNDIEFSPEDAGRSDRKFLVQVLESVIQAGATTLNIPDTVGYNTPTEYGDMIKYLIENTPSSDKVIWSTHCHNDLGLATANTLSGITNGARQVEVTINGIGERAGNTSMEEIIMTLYTHPDFYPVHLSPHVKTTEIWGTSLLVSELTGMSVQGNKAIVGGNAFAHESGIHQDGILKNPSTYEIINPKIIGIPSSHKNLVLGKHSGRSAIKSALSSLLPPLDFEALIKPAPKGTLNAFERVFEGFKKLADEKGGIVTDDDLIRVCDVVFGRRASVEDVVEEEGGKYELGEVFVMCGTGIQSTATVTLTSSKTTYTDAATGTDGPIASIFKCIDRIVEPVIKHTLSLYEVKAVTGGSDALGKVTVKICVGGERYFVGKGVDEDILIASAKAYLGAVNGKLRSGSFDEQVVGKGDGAGV